MFSRIQIVPEPFTNKLQVMTQVELDIPNHRYRHWTWTSDLRYLRKKSGFRPVVYNIKRVK